jgi:hypothetical protein
MKAYCSLELCTVQCIVDKSPEQFLVEFRGSRETEQEMARRLHTVLSVIKRGCKQVPINQIIRARTRHFRHAYHSIRDGIILCFYLTNNLHQDTR